MKFVRSAYLSRSIQGPCSRSIPWSETTIRSIGQLQPGEFRPQISHQLIDVLHRGGSLRAVGSILMPGMIDIRVIERDKVRPLRGRHAQPGNDLFDALVIRKVVVKLEVVGWPLAGNLRLRAGPKEARAAHALLLRQHPQRNAAVPASVAVGGRIVIE